jgi:hypothetical protein
VGERKRRHASQRPGSIMTKKRKSFGCKVGQEQWGAAARREGGGRRGSSQHIHPQPTHTYLVLGIDQMPLRPRLLGGFQRRVLHGHGQAGVDGRGSGACGCGGRHGARLGLGLWLMMMMMLRGEGARREGGELRRKRETCRGLTSCCCWNECRERVG